MYLCFFTKAHTLKVNLWQLTNGWNSAVKQQFSNMEMKVLSENFEIQAANGIFFKWITPEAYNSFPFLFPFLKERLFQLSDALPGDVDKNLHTKRSHIPRNQNTFAIVFLQLPLFWCDEAHKCTHVCMYTQACRDQTLPVTLLQQVDTIRENWCGSFVGCAIVPSIGQTVRCMHADVH